MAGTDIVFIGKGHDSDGNLIEILEDTVTKQRFAAYSIEAWEQRCRRLQAVRQPSRQFSDRSQRQVVSATSATDLGTD